MAFCRFSFTHPPATRTWDFQGLLLSLCLKAFIQAEDPGFLWYNPSSQSNYKLKRSLGSNPTLNDPCDYDQCKKKSPTNRNASSLFEQYPYPNFSNSSKSLTELFLTAGKVTQSLAGSPGLFPFSVSLSLSSLNDTCLSLTSGQLISLRIHFLDPRKCVLFIDDLICSYCWGETVAFLPALSHSWNPEILISMFRFLLSAVMSFPSGSLTFKVHYNLQFCQQRFLFGFSNTGRPGSGR